MSDNQKDKPKEKEPDAQANVAVSEHILIKDLTLDKVIVNKRGA